MDSDDEYMSALSSEDDIALDDSDNEDMSGGEGASTSCIASTPSLVKAYTNHL